MSDLPRTSNVHYPWRLVDGVIGGPAVIEHARTGTEREGWLIERDGQVLYLEAGPDVDALSTEARDA